MGHKDTLLVSLYASNLPAAVPIWLLLLLLLHRLQLPFEEENNRWVLKDSPVKLNLQVTSCKFFATY